MEGLAILGKIIMGIAVVGVIMVVILIIAQWKMFKKAGQPGWLVLIPFYGQYKMYDICWNKKIYWVVLILSIIFNTLDSVLLVSLCSILSIVIYVIFSINLSRAFGFSDAFALGLIFLPVIFYLIAAFSKNEYVGKKNQLFDVNI